MEDKAVFEVELNSTPPTALWEVVPAYEEFLECSICLRNVVDRTPRVTLCGHLFCNDCIIRTINHHKKCPTCQNNSTVTSQCLVLLSK